MIEFLAFQVGVADAVSLQRLAMEESCMHPSTDSENVAANYKLAFGPECRAVSLAGFRPDVRVSAMKQSNPPSSPSIEPDKVGADVRLPGVVAVAIAETTKV